MGCVSSTLLNQEDDFPQLGSTGLSHHIVSLTSTTYGLLSLDPPPSQSLSSTSPSSSPATTPPAQTRRFTLGSVFPSPLSSEPRTKPEVINSWELMAGLDNDSFRFSPLPSCRSRPSTPKFFSPIFNRNKENNHPNRQLRFGNKTEKPTIFKPLTEKFETRSSSSLSKYNLDGFPKLCPPNGENKIVLYTTTLRGVRKTFEECTAVRSAIQGLGFQICERDISMDRGFREELNELMKERKEVVPPRVFVKGRYLGGAEEVLRIHEEGFLVQLFDGMARLKFGEVCDGCGGTRFLPCFQCNGSCKMVMVVKDEVKKSKRRSTVVVRCSDCNENGLVLCPICS